MTARPFGKKGFVMTTEESEEAELQLEKSLSPL